MSTSNGFTQNNHSHQPSLRLVLPSDGDLHEPTLNFMRGCGLTVLRPNARRYTATIPALPGVEVLFQRTADITPKVEEGSAELGVTGLDRVLEYRASELLAEVLIEDLGFGRCDFVLAVPDAWLDVTSLADLADLALEFRQEGKQLRIATKYPRLLRAYLHERGINYFTLVPASGAMEAAPAAGYADLIADITATGATLRENRLRTVEDGTILSSQACLVANPALLGKSAAAFGLARSITEMMEAHLRAGPFYRISANVQGPSAEAVSATILARPALSGLRGPTVSKVYDRVNSLVNDLEEDWFSVSLLVEKGCLLEAVDHLRSCGAADVSASQLDYLFLSHSQAYEKMFGNGSTSPE